MTDDVSDIIKKLNRFAVDTEKAVDDAVAITAHKVRVSAIRSMREPSIGKKHGKHIASKPGDAPNVDTGRLVASVKVQHDKGSAVARVGTNLDYGAELELVKNRPWLKPALDENVDDYEQILEKVVDKQIREAGR